MALQTKHSAGSSEDELNPEIFAEINITPLTDIFLVLLIIFMVTSSVMSQMGVNVDLPASSTATAQPMNDGVIVSLKPGGQLYINEVEQPQGRWDLFEKKLGAELSRTKDGVVVLEGDQKAFLGLAVEVMDHAKKVGAKSFAISTKPD